MLRVGMDVDGVWINGEWGRCYVVLLIANAKDMDGDGYRGNKG